MDLFGDDTNTAHHRAALFLQIIDDRAGLLVERETGVYAFAHLTFQEYLAARALADRDDYIDYTLQRLHIPWWREVLLLQVGHLIDVRQFRRARRLTSNLIRAIRNAGSWLEDVLKRDFFFAVRCLCDTGKLGVDDDLRKSLIDELITLWHTTPYEPQRQEIVALFAYAMPTIDGEHIREEVFRCLDDIDMRLAAVEALGRSGAAVATPGILECLVALTTDEAEGVRRAAAGALGKLDVAATPMVLECLVALIADEEPSVSIEAGLALGELSVAVVTPIVPERLVALIADRETSVYVGMNAAMTLGELGTVAATPVVLERLVVFWQKYLVNFEGSLIFSHYVRVCDIAYSHLQRILVQQSARVSEAPLQTPG